MDAVDLRNLTKTFGENTVVDDLTLAVPEGSVYGFTGPNASGKTTAMRMIVNILSHESFDHVSIREDLHESRSGADVCVGIRN
jgi:ABC-type multidrug transport system ATPase subunit